MSNRTYLASVGEVFSYVGMDRKFIRALAYICDELELWKNPDDADYQTPLKKIPHFVFIDGEMYGHRYQHEQFLKDFSAEVMSHDIRSRNTLCELAKMYKRLKAGPEIYGVVFENILLKMLWISSGRNQILKAA